MRVPNTLIARIEALKAELEQEGLSYTDIARTHGVRPQSVKDFFGGRTMGRRGDSHTLAIGLGIKRVRDLTKPHLKLDCSGRIHVLRAPLPPKPNQPQKIFSPQAKTLDRLLVAYSVIDLAQLAQKIGVPLNTVKSWSRRDSVPLNYMIDAARDTGASLDYLILGICPQGAST